jgi:hypothetical protein
VARGRHPARPGQAWAALPEWPLDPPPVATPPTAAHAPVATPPTDHRQGPTAPTVGGYIPTPGHGPGPGPGPRAFYCRQCRRAVQAADCPDQWLRLQLRDADAERRDGRAFTTVALLCSVGCLAAWATTTNRVTP